MRKRKKIKSKNKKAYFFHLNNICYFDSQRSLSSSSRFRRWRGWRWVWERNFV